MSQNRYECNLSKVGAFSTPDTREVIYYKNFDTKWLQQNCAPVKWNMQQSLTYLDQLQEPCWMPQKGTDYLAVETNFTTLAISPVKRKSQLLCFVGKQLNQALILPKNHTMKCSVYFTTNCSRCKISTTGCLPASIASGPSSITRSEN